MAGGLGIVQLGGILVEHTHVGKHVAGDVVQGGTHDVSHLRGDRHAAAAGDEQVAGLVVGPVVDVGHSRVHVLAGGGDAHELGGLDIHGLGGGSAGIHGVGQQAIVVLEQLGEGGGAVGGGPDGSSLALAEEVVFLAHIHGGFRHVLDGAGVMHALHGGEVVNQHLRVEAGSCLVGVVQLAAMLAGDDAEGAEVQALHVKAELAGLLMELQHPLFKLVPGHLVGGNLHAGVFHQLAVGHHAQAVGASVDAVQAAIDHAAAQHAFRYVGHVDGAGFHQGRQVHQQALFHIALDVLIVHAQAVGQIVTGGQGVHLGPVVIPGVVFGLHVDAGRFNEHVHHAQVDLVAGLGAPPAHPHGFVGKRRRAQAQQHGHGQQDSHQFLHGKTSLFPFLIGIA